MFPCRPFSTRAPGPPDADVPIYAYRCNACNEVTDAFASLRDIPERIRCGHCGGGETHRIISRVAYHASESTKTAKLDPKYEKMVDHAMKKSANADENRLIQRMTRSPSEPKK